MRKRVVAISIRVHRGGNSLPYCQVMNSSREKIALLNHENGNFCGLHHTLFAIYSNERIYKENERVRGWPERDGGRKTERRLDVVKRTGNSDLDTTRGWKNLWIFAAIGAVLLLAVAASARFATWLDGPGDAAARRLDSGWSYLLDGAFQPIQSLPCTLEVPGRRWFCATP